MGNTNTDSKDACLEQLYKAHDYARTEVDKSLTFISSGILGVSFAFIEKIIKLENATSKNILIEGWYLLGIAIFLSVAGHLASTWILRLTIIFYKPVDDIRQKRTRDFGDIFVYAVKIVTLTLILIGSLDIISFIKINI